MTALHPATRSLNHPFDSRATDRAPCARSAVLWKQTFPANSDARVAGIRVGWGGRTRTCECGNQNPVPYHLATPQPKNPSSGRHPVAAAPPCRESPPQRRFVDAAHDPRAHASRTIRHRRRARFARRKCREDAPAGTAEPRLAVPAEPVERRRDCRKAHPHHRLERIAGSDAGTKERNCQGQRVSCQFRHLEQLARRHLDAGVDDDVPALRQRQRRDAARRCPRPRRWRPGRTPARRLRAAPRAPRAPPRPVACPRSRSARPASSRHPSCRRRARRRSARSCRSRCRRRAGNRSLRAMPSLRARQGRRRRRHPAADRCGESFRPRANAAAPRRPNQAAGTPSAAGDSRRRAGRRCAGKG